MAVPSIVTQVVQLGVESVAGQAVAATKRMSAMSFEPSPQTEINTFRPTGSKVAALTALNKEWAEGNLSGQATYTEIIYALASVMGNMSTAAEGATAAFRHTFHIKTRGQDTVKTFTIEKGDPFLGNAFRMTNVRINEFTLTFSHDGIEIGGSILGSAIEQNVQMSTNEQQLLTMSTAGGAATGGTFTITYAAQTTAAIAYNASAAAVQTALEALSNIEVGDVLVTGAAGGPWTIEFRQNLAQTNVASVTTDAALVTGPGSPYTLAVSTPTAGVPPTEVALVPVLPTQVNIYLNDTYGAIGTTQLLNVLSVEVSIGNRFGTYWPLNRSLGSSFGGVLESVPDMSVTITLANDDDAADFYTMMRAGATKFLRIECIGPQADGVAEYELVLDFALAISNSQGFSEEDPIYAAGFDLAVVNDPTWGQGLSVEVVNLLSSL